MNIREHRRIGTGWWQSLEWSCKARLEQRRKQERRRDGQTPLLLAKLDLAQSPGGHAFLSHVLFLSRHWEWKQDQDA